MNVNIVKEKIVLAVDIGGTKVAAGAISTSGRILDRVVVPTVQKDPKAGIDQIISVLEALIHRLDLYSKQIVGIGIGIPAVLEQDTDFIIWGPNLKGWKKVDLRSPLEAHFNLPVAVEYDGHTAVLGEWWMGAGKGFHSLVSIIIGTGVGGGMVLDGNLIRGINRLAGAVGWFIIDPKAGIDHSSERSLGSWEARIAGVGIARRARQLLDSSEGESSSLHPKSSSITAADVFEAAKKGDALSARLAQEEADLIGMGIANIVSLVNPQIVILGGSVGTNASFLLPQIKKTMELYAQPISSQSVQITTSKLGTDAGLFGAAYGIMLRLGLVEAHRKDDKNKNIT